MLCLTRKVDQVLVLRRKDSAELRINGVKIPGISDVRIRVNKIGLRGVQLGIEAPPHIEILREELVEREET